MTSLSDFSSIYSDIRDLAVSDITEGALRQYHVISLFERMDMVIRSVFHSRQHGLQLGSDTIAVDLLVKSFSAHTLTLGVSYMPMEGSSFP